MRKVITAAATATVLISALVAAPAADAHQARSGCVDRAKYSKIKHGQTVDRVARELRHRGKIESDSHFDGYRDQERSYPACGRYSFVDVDFSADPGQELRVESKDAYWG